MSIDFKTETIIDLKREAPAYLGKSRNGRPVHYSFLIRAVTKGVNGHRLEALRVGSRWLTTIEALQRWCESQTDSTVMTPERRTAAARNHAAERAATELKKLGL
jgi:hypothetical protein